MTHSKRVLGLRAKQKKETEANQKTEKCYSQLTKCDLIRGVSLNTSRSNTILTMQN